MSEDCIFCLIAERRSPAQFVDEDEGTLAFMDIHPWRRGHALVIPRRHARDLFEIEPEDLAMVFATAKLAGIDTLLPSLASGGRVLTIRL